MPAVGSGRSAQRSARCRRGRADAKQLLLDDVRDLADAALEDVAVLEHRRLDRLVAVARASGPCRSSRRARRRARRAAGRGCRAGPETWASSAQSVRGGTVPTSSQPRRGGDEHVEPSQLRDFTGFSHRDALQFLVDLALNNDRAWFQPRKADYERLLKEPLEALCVDLGERFAARGVPLTADPRQSPFRIYRDTRFSQGQVAVQDERGRQLPLGRAGQRRGRRPAGTPAATSTCRPRGTYMGGGMWHPEPGAAGRLSARRGRPTRSGVGRCCPRRRLLESASSRSTVTGSSACRPVSRRPSARRSCSSSRT